MFTPENDIGTHELKAGAIVIATGSKANRFPPVDYGLPGVYDTDTIWRIDRIPKSLLVL